MAKLKIWTPTSPLLKLQNKLNLIDSRPPIRLCIHIYLHRKAVRGNENYYKERICNQLMLKFILIQNIKDKRKEREARRNIAKCEV